MRSLWQVFRDGFLEGTRFFYQPLGGRRVGELRARLGFALTLTGGVLLATAVVISTHARADCLLRFGFLVQAIGVVTAISGFAARWRDLKRRRILHDRNLWD